MEEAGGREIGEIAGTWTVGSEVEEREKRVEEGREKGGRRKRKEGRRRKREGGKVEGTTRRREERWRD